MSFNNFAWLEGNITESPVLSKTKSDRSVLNIRMATNDSWRNVSSGEYEQNTVYHRVVFWGEQAEFVHRNFKKGSAIKVQGHIEYAKSESNGTVYINAEIVADRVDFGPKTKAELLKSEQGQEHAPEGGEGYSGAGSDETSTQETAHAQ